MSEESALTEKALFQVRYDKQIKLAVLSYKNKEWLDVIRTAIAQKRSSDDVEDSENDKSSKKTTTTTKSADKLRNNVIASSVPKLKVKQNFSGVSFKEAKLLVRKLFSIQDGHLIKFFNPRTREEIRSKHQFSSALEIWQNDYPSRWKKYYIALATSILVHLTAYCQRKTSNTSAVSSAFGKTFTPPLNETVETAPEKDKLINLESHKEVLEAFSQLEHCICVMKNAIKTKGLLFMTHSDWDLFLSRCWHHLLRACRSSDYVVATKAANLLSKVQEFDSVGEENRMKEQSRQVANGTAFLCLLINHGNSESAQKDPQLLTSCFYGLGQSNFQNAKDFFMHPRPHDVSEVTSPLIAMLGTCVSDFAAEFLASSLSLSSPNKLSGVINEMIVRSESESYMLGLKLVMTMSNTKEGRGAVWSHVHVYNRTVEIGNNILEQVGNAFFQARTKNKRKNQNLKQSYSEVNQQHILTLRLVAHALMTHLLSAPDNKTTFIDIDSFRKKSYKNSLNLLVKLVWSLDALTANYACGALAILAHGNLLHYDASEDLLQLIELPAVLGVTHQAAVTLCNITYNNPSQNEHNTLVFLSRCAKTLAVRARNHCESHVQKYVSTSMLYVSKNYKRKRMQDSSTCNEKVKKEMLIAAEAILSPLRMKELIYGDSEATENVIRCIWNIGTKDSDLLQAFIFSGAISMMLNICSRFIPTVEEIHRKKRIHQQKKSSRTKFKQHETQNLTQEERLVISSLGALYLLTTNKINTKEDHVNNMKWLLHLIFQLMNIDGPSRTILLTLAHALLRSSKKGSLTDRRAIESWSKNERLIDHLLECTKSIYDTFTKLQALAILDYLGIPATTTNKNGVTYGHTMINLLQSQDFIACGDAASLLSRWALVPELRQFLLNLESGKYVVKVISNTAEYIASINCTNKKELLRDSNKRYALLALLSAIRATRNLSIHHSFQKSIGKHGIEALSIALAILEEEKKYTQRTNLQNTTDHKIEEYDLHANNRIIDAQNDARTALYCLGRNPVNISVSYKIHLQMQAERLKFEKEKSARTALETKANTSISIRRQIIQSGATKSRIMSSPKRGGLWEKKRRDTSLNHWISSPLSAKHVISKDEDLMLKKVIPLSTRLCRPNALLLSSMNPDNATFRYQDHWKPPIKSLEYEPFKGMTKKYLQSKEDERMVTELREKLSKAVMNAEKYTRPLSPETNNKRPLTAPIRRKNAKSNSKTNRPKTAPRTKSYVYKTQSRKNDLGREKNRPTTAPSKRKINKNMRSKAHRPSTASPASRKIALTPLTSTSKIYSNIQFALILENASRVRFKSRFLSNVDSKTEEGFEKDDDNFDVVKCCRFDAIPDTSTSKDVDIPTYQLPDGRFTHYYVKTDLQPAAEGIPCSPAPQILSMSKVFPGIHFSTELQSHKISLEPDLTSLQQLSTVTRLNSSSNEYSKEMPNYKINKNASNTVLIQNNEDTIDNMIQNKYSYKPTFMMIDVLLKTVGKRMAEYNPPSSSGLPWCIYNSMYSYRVQDPTSVFTGNDSLSSESLIAADWDQIVALHPDVFIVNESPLKTSVLKHICSTLVRHSQFLMEAYALFRSGCSTLFGENVETENLFRELCPRLDVGRHCFLASIIKLSSIMINQSKDIVSCLEDQILTLEHAIAKVATRCHIDFRWKYLYNKETMEIIEKHENQLHIFYMFFAEGDGLEITIDQWISFVSILQIELETFFVSLIFKWSCSLGQTTLKFHDFVEAICRLSLRVPLPSKEECGDFRGSAFLFLQNVRKAGQIRQWEKERQISWKASTNLKVVDVLPQLIDLVDRKLRVARNIQHFISGRYNRWKQKEIDKK
jgi:hypothetical protein